MASKLVKMWTTTRGETAASITAHTLRPAVSAVAQMVTSQHNASPSATRLKKTTTSNALGKPQLSCAHCQASVA